MTREVTLCINSMQEIMLGPEMTFVDPADPDVKLTQEQYHLAGMHSQLTEALASAEFRIYAQEYDNEYRKIDLECEFVIEKDNYSQFKAIHRFARQVGAEVSLMGDYGFPEDGKELMLYDVSVLFPMGTFSFSDIKNKKAEMLEAILADKTLLGCIHRVY